MTTDSDLLAMLDASPVLVVVAEDATGSINSVYQGYPAVSTTTKVIDLPLPYLVYSTALGPDRGERHSGGVGGRVMPFRLTGVGRSEAQVKFILDEAAKMLNRKRLGGSLIKRSTSADEIRRDDEYTRPGGKPLFVCVDRYNVAV